jgi:hypothetical protein
MKIMRAVLLAIYFALAPSEHESMWAALESRPHAVLPIGVPMVPLVRPNTSRLQLPN